MVSKTLSKVGLYRETKIGGDVVVDWEFIGADPVMLEELSSTLNSLREQGEIEDVSNFKFDDLIKIVNHNTIDVKPDFNTTVKSEFKQFKEYMDKNMQSN